MSVKACIWLATHVYPTMFRPAVSLEDKLVEVAIHENCEPFAKLLNVLDVDIARLTLHVLRGVFSTYGFVQCRAAIARGDDNWLFYSLTQRFEDSLAEVADCRDELLRHSVVYASCFSCGGE